MISSNSSCKSASLILFARLGISILASSAVSQHRLPSSYLALAQKCATAMRLSMHTELRSLEELQLHFRVQQPLDGFNILLGFESCEDIQVVVRLVEYPGVREPQVSSKTLILSTPTCASYMLREAVQYKETHSPSFTAAPCFLCSITTLMSSRASERVRHGTFWKSPSLRVLAASSSPVGFSRARVV